MTDKEKLRDILDKADIGCYVSRTEIVIDAYNVHTEDCGEIVYVFDNQGTLIRIYLK